MLEKLETVPAVPLLLWYRKVPSVMSLEGRASLLLSVTNIHVFSQFYVRLLPQCLLLFPQIWNIVASSNKAVPLPLRWPFLSNPRFQFKSEAFLSPIVSHHRGNVEKKNAAGRENVSFHTKRWPLDLAWGGSSCRIFCHSLRGAAGEQRHLLAKCLHPPKNPQTQSVLMIK